MYSDKKKPLILRLIPAIVVIVIAGLLVLFFSARGSDLTEESASAIKAAVERSAKQCYAVEGVYPPNLQYLQDNYGLQVNTDDFFISYEAFASNLPPDVVVKVK